LKELGHLEELTDTESGEAKGHTKRVCLCIWTNGSCLIEGIFVLVKI